MVIEEKSSVKLLLGEEMLRRPSDNAIVFYRRQETSSKPSIYLECQPTLQEKPGHERWNDTTFSSKPRPKTVRISRSTRGFLAPRQEISLEFDIIYSFIAG